MGRAPFLGRLSGSLFALLVCTVGMVIPASAGDMPKDFVYLHDVDPTIQQDMCYAGADNFTGHKVSGYNAPECMLVRRVAEALKAVEADLKGNGSGSRSMIAIVPRKPWRISSIGRRSRTIPTPRPCTIPPSARRRCFRRAISPPPRAISAAPPWILRSFRSTPHQPRQCPMDAALGPARRRKPSGKPIRASTWAPASIVST